MGGIGGGTTGCDLRCERESQREGAEARLVFVRIRVTMVVGRTDDEDLKSVEDIFDAPQRLVACSVLNSWWL